MKDEEVKAAAIAFAKRNKNRIARELTDKTKYIPDTDPISVFMAGSPGAGKTEMSKIVISMLEYDERHVVRIDGDEIRPLLPGYVGNNSHLFQGAVSLIVEKMHDYALHQKQSFVLDGTFSRYEKAIDNIRRSHRKDRLVLVFYLYQKPEVAWKFTQAREKAEGRNIPKSAFIDQFLEARETVDRVSKELKEKTQIFLVKEDFETNRVENIMRIGDKGSQIDDYILERYTQSDLEKLL